MEVKSCGDDEERKMRQREGKKEQKRMTRGGGEWRNLGALGLTFSMTGLYFNLRRVCVCECVYQMAALHFK